MLTRKLKIILLSAIGIGVILVTSIQRHRGMPADVLVPNAVTEFHRQEHSRESGTDLLLLITWFRLPYPNYFDVIRIESDGHLLEWTESPGWSSAGWHSMTISGSDLERIRTLASTLSSIQSTAVPGSRYLIAVSFPADTSYNLSSCSETNCPSNLCIVFEMADTMIKQQIPGAVGIDCPILR